MRSLKRLLPVTLVACTFTIAFAMTANQAEAQLKFHFSTGGGSGLHVSGSSTYFGGHTSHSTFVAGGHTFPGHSTYVMGGFVPPSTTVMSWHPTTLVPHGDHYDVMPGHWHMYPSPYVTTHPLPGLDVHDLLHHSGIHIHGYDHGHDHDHDHDHD
ncbi:MAG: hypothetical protein ACR2NP_06355 [Pirellulaceae bacterium]